MPRVCEPPLFEPDDPLFAGRAKISVRFVALPSSFCAGTSLWALARPPPPRSQGSEVPPRRRENLLVRRLDFFHRIDNLGYQTRLIQDELLHRLSQ